MANSLIILHELPEEGSRWTISPVLPKATGETFHIRVETVRVTDAKPPIMAVIHFVLLDEDGNQQGNATHQRELWVVPFKESIAGRSQIVSNGNV